MDDETSTIFDVTQCDTYSEPGMIDWMAIILLLLLILVICTSNGLVLIIFIRARRLRTITNFYIMQLAIADFGLGCSLPFNVYTYFDYDIVLVNNYLCALLFATYLVFCCASFSGLSALTYDRYLAITNPLRYHDVMSPKRYVVSGLSIWIPSLILGFIPMVWHQDMVNMTCPDCRLQTIVKRDYFRILIIPGFIIVSAFMMTLYILIFKVALKQMKHIQQMDVSAAGTKSEEKKKATSRHQMKLVRAGMIVFATFYACWLPFFILILVQMYGGFFESTIVRFIYVLTSLMGTFNSAINPVIYTVRLPVFKRELKKLLCRGNFVDTDATIITVKEQSV